MTEPPTAEYPQYPHAYGYPPVTVVPAQPPAPRKSRTWLWVTLIVVPVLVACCGLGGVGGYFWWNSSARTESLESPSPSVSSRRSPSPSPSPKTTVVLSAPDTIGSWEKVENSELTDELDGFRSFGTGEPVAGIYGNDSDESMMVMGFPTQSPSSSLQKLQLDAMFAGMGNGGDITNVTEVDPGPLGGHAKCGEMEDTVEGAICGWSDDQSLGVVIWYFQSLSRVKGEFLTIRAAIETRKAAGAPA